MNIDKEVEKYNKKKDQLLMGLISRLVGYANSRRKAVANIDSAVSDLADQKIVHLNEIDIVDDHLKFLK